MGVDKSTPRGGLRVTDEVDKSPSFVPLRPHPLSLTKKQEPDDEDDSHFCFQSMRNLEIVEYLPGFGRRDEFG
jgi:hypothetical protein